MSQVKRVKQTEEADNKAETSETTTSESSETPGTPVVDLCDKKYKGFVTIVTNRELDGWPPRVWCNFLNGKVRTHEEADEDEDIVFDFLAIPIEKHPDLAALQKYVGGCIEMVTPVKDIAKAGYKKAWANDEGMIRKLPFNPDASAFARGQLFGNVVFTRK